MKLFILLTICVLTVSPRDMSLLERLENKLYSFINPDQQLKFKNVPLKLDNSLASKIVATAARSSKAVPEPLETLDSVIKECLNSLQASSPASIETMYNSLDEISEKVMELDGTFISVADMKKCFIDDKTECFFEMLEVQIKWNYIQKQIKNTIRFKPSFAAAFKYNMKIFDDLRKKARGMKNFLKQAYLAMVSLAKRGKTSDFGRFTQIKNQVQKALREIVRKINFLSVYRKDTEKIIDSIRPDIEEDLNEAILLREYLKREPTLKLSDIITFFKEHVESIKKIQKPAYEPKLPVIDELPELEDLQQAEIEDEIDLDYFEKLIVQKIKIGEIIKNQPTKQKKKGFFSKLMSVLTLGSK